MTSRHRDPGRLRGLLLAAALPVALAACQTGRPDVTGSIRPTDHRDRHPIVIADGPRVLDLFVEGTAGLSPRSRHDLADYADEYRRFGSGPLLVQVPAGGGSNPNTARALAAIRERAGASATVQAYSPTDPAVASPIRLTFRRLQARVGSKCGLWPDDLGVSDGPASWKNEEYWNFGCAHQANLASQVADPNDLVRGRAETRPDTGRRMFNIQQLRVGEDPSTKWKQADSVFQTTSSATSQ